MPIVKQSVARISTSWICAPPSCALRPRAVPKAAFGVLGAVEIRRLEPTTPNLATSPPDFCARRFSSTRESAIRSLPSPTILQPLSHSLVQCGMERIPGSASGIAMVSLRLPPLLQAVYLLQTTLHLISPHHCSIMWSCYLSEGALDYAWTQETSGPKLLVVSLLNNLNRDENSECSPCLMQGNSQDPPSGYESRANIDESSESLQSC